VERGWSCAIGLSKAGCTKGSLLIIAVNDKETSLSTRRALMRSGEMVI
jgi:hypothetical protein